MCRLLFRAGLTAIRHAVVRISENLVAYALLVRCWVFQAACTLPIGVQAAIGLNL